MGKGKMGNVIGQRKLGKVLKSYRESQGLSLRTMAEEIGIGFTVLTRIEQGKSCEAVTFWTITGWLFKESAEDK